MSNTMRLLANIVLFQIGWFACLLLSFPLVLLVAVLILSSHFYFIVEPGERRQESVVVALVLVAGLILESLYLLSDVLIRVDGSYLPAFWLLLIWVLFATTFRYSLSWLRPKLWLAALFAGVAAPMSYYAGANLNASVALNENLVFSLLTISISWAIAFPVLMKVLVPIAKR